MLKFETIHKKLQTSISVEKSSKIISFYKVVTGIKAWLIFT